MNLRSIARGAAAAAILVGLSVSPAQAAAINLTSPGLEYGSGLYTLGFSFTVTTTLQVMALGVYDSGQNGLENTAQVAIWTDTGTPLVSTTVPGGTSPSLDGYFRYVNITPLTLTPGNVYVVGSYLRDGIASSLGTNQGGAGTYDPRFNIIQDRFSPFDSTFGFPTATNFFPGGAWLGANIRTEAVPEPVSMVLVGSGLLGVGLRRWRGRRV